MKKFMYNDKVIIILLATFLAVSYLIIKSGYENYVAKKYTGKNINDLPLSSIFDTSDNNYISLGDFKNGVTYIGDCQAGSSQYPSKSIGFYIDKTGKIITDRLKMVNYSNVSEDLIAVTNRKFQVGYMNSDGKMILDYKYKVHNDGCGGFHEYDFKEGMAVVYKEDKWGVYDKWGYINKKGELVIDYIYDAALHFSEGLAAVIKNGSWGFIDKKGNVVIDFQYKWASSFSEGLAVVENYDGKQGYIDKKGNLVIDCVYEDAENFSEGLAAVNQFDENGKYRGYGYIDKSGNLVLDYQYDSRNSFKEGLAAVQKNGKYGYIDKNGNVVINYQYSEANNFNEGLAVVCASWKNCGYIDRNGNTLTGYVYNEANPFSEGLGAVRYKNGDLAYIDKTGNKVIDLSLNK